MKKIQCTKCGQVFWTDLQVDEALIASGEWIKTACPKCQGEWAVVGPGGKRGKMVGMRRAKPAVRRRIRPKEAAGGKIAVFTPARIRNLRRKIEISQRELAALMGVNRATVALWETGKFKPKEAKMAQLTGLAEKGKEKVKKLLAEKISPPAEKKNENVQAGKPKGKERIRRKGIPLPQ